MRPVGGVLALLMVGAVVGCGAPSSGSAGSATGATTTLTRSVSGFGIPADIGVYLASGISDTELNSLMDVLFFTEREDGRGLDMIDGVRRVQADYDVMAIYVDFDEEVAQGRRDEIIATAENAPDVMRVDADAVVGE